MMTCKSVQDYLPLLSGGDLGARKEKRLLSHLDRCPGCRAELEEYRSALARLKAASGEEAAADWTAAEWKALMVAAAAQKAQRKGAAAGSRPRWALASGLAAVILLAVLAFLFRGSIFRSHGTEPDREAAVVKKEEPKPAPAKPAPAKPPGEKGKRVPVVQPEYYARSADTKGSSAASPAKAASGQDVISVKMVSRETGLQVVWFFNRNFEWKGDQK